MSAVTATAGVDPPALLVAGCCRCGADSTVVYQQPAPARDRAGDFGVLELVDGFATWSLGDRTQDPLPEQMRDAVE